MKKRTYCFVLMMVLFSSALCAQDAFGRQRVSARDEMGDGKAEVLQTGYSRRVRRFRSDGSLYSEMSFVWGVPHGSYSVFYENGQASEKGEYFLGLKIRGDFFYRDGAAKSPQVERLEKKIARMGVQSNVHLHHQAGAFFELAGGYLKDGRKEDARKVLEAGVRLAPFHGAAQLMLAEMDIEDGDISQAVKRLRFIEKDSKEKKTRLRAKKLLQQYASAEEGDWPVTLPLVNRVLYVAFTDGMPREMAFEIAAGIKEEFAIEAVVLDAPYMVPQGALVGSQERYLDLIIGRAFATSTFEQLNAVLKNAHIEGRPRTLEEKKRFYQVYIRRTEGEEACEYRERVLQQQLDADLLLNSAVPLYKTILNGPGTFGVLIVTEQDLRADDLNFIFGTADIAGRIGIMSIARFAGDDPSFEKLKTRSLKQAFSTVGFIAGIGRCTMPECARAYPHSLAEHDKKETKICGLCRKRLAEVYQLMEVQK